MAPLTADEQFEFLINCIKYSHQGKPNFEEVARECNIVSKSAAAKRYERLVKSHGISPSAIVAPSPSKSDKGGDDSEPAAPVSATKAGGAKRKSAAGKAAPNKRSRKKAAVASAERIVQSDDKEEDDEDGGSEDKGDGAAGDAGIRQKTDEAEEEVV